MTVASIIRGLERVSVQMEAVEELSDLRKSHAKLQEKYKELCEEIMELKTECACLRDSEATLVKC